MKLNWTAIGVLVPLALVAGGWVIHVERGLSAGQDVSGLRHRIENLEGLLQPVLVEYYVQKRLKALRGEVAIHFEDVPEPPMAPAPAPHLAPPEEELREEAREWAEKQFKK